MSSKGSGKAKGGKGKASGSGDGSKRMSRSAKAGLQSPWYVPFFVLRSVLTLLPVYLAAVLEYLAAEVRESAGSAARDNKKQHIVPRHLQLANRNAAVLEYLTVEVLLCQGWSPVSLVCLFLRSSSHSHFPSSLSRCCSQISYCQGLGISWQCRS